MITVVIADRLGKDKMLQRSGASRWSRGCCSRNGR